MLIDFALRALFLIRYRGGYGLRQKGVYYTSAAGDDLLLEGKEWPIKIKTPPRKRPAINRSCMHNGELNKGKKGNRGGVEGIKSRRQETGFVRYTNAKGKAQRGTSSPGGVLTYETPDVKEKEWKNKRIGRSCEETSILRENPQGTEDQHPTRKPAGGAREFFLTRKDADVVREHRFAGGGKKENI